MKSRITAFFALAALGVSSFAFSFRPENPENPTSKPINKSAIDTTGMNKVFGANGMVTFSSGLENSYYMLDEDGSNAYLYVEAKMAKYTPRDKKRTPLNLCVVIDHSGSMQGKKLEYAKKAAAFVVDQLNEDDYVSIVMYDSKVDVVYASTVVKDKKAIKDKIATINDAGGTNLGGGLVEGYSQVKKTFKSGYVNRVLLMSDGLANEGITNPDALYKIAKEQCQEYKISTSTFGIGLDFNENLMKGLAEYGCGNYYFIDDPEHIPVIFEKELNGLLNLVASDMKLTIKIPQGLVLEKVYGYVYNHKDNTVTIDFRDVFSEETKAVLLKMNVLGSTNTDQQFTASLTFKNATNSDKAEQTLTLENVLKPTENEELFNKSVCEKVKEQVVLFESNDMMEQAMKKADEGDYDAARTITNNNTIYLEKNAAVVSKSEELQIQAGTNANYNNELRNAEVKSDAEKKSMQKMNKEMNYKSAKKKAN